MSQFVLYTTRFCPFCIRAKHLLDSKGLKYQEIAVDGDARLRQEMMTRSGRRTVPQIWYGDRHIGGCDDLFAFERSGELKRMLSDKR